MSTFQESTSGLEVQPDEKLPFSSPSVQSTRLNSASVSRKNKSNQPPYHFPGVGKCTRSMDVVAPVNPTAPPPANNHCVYDVANLGPAQRRVPAPVATKKTPKSMFGAKKPTVGDKFVLLKEC